MADINVERKSTNIWPWILGLLVLALLIWLLAEAFGRDEAEVADVPVTEVQPTVPPVAPEPIAQEAGVPVSQIIESPATWTGRTVAGEVRVVEVPTDRGFWIEDQGERLFALIVDEPREVPVDINAGQTLRIREAVLRDPTFIGNIPGEPIDADTRRILNGLPVFLIVDEENVEILSRGS